MLRFIKEFPQLEAASSIVLLIMTLLGMVAANTPLAAYYITLHNHIPSLVINDGLMSLFFLLIGIELKHEMTDGNLATLQQAILPVMAALGGIMLPVIIYTGFNFGLPSMAGWAIPSATDIAFSLGVLALFGSRIPAALRVFLMAVAVIDDLAAAIIIAVFYTSELSYPALAVALGCVVLLYLYSRHISRMLPYLFAGAALWVAMLDSGVHPAIAGVLFGLLLPAPLGKTFTRILHPWVAYGIVPLFAFANAGIPLDRLNWNDVTNTVSAGILLGLFLGKQTGIYIVTDMLVRCKLAALPAQTTRLQFYAVCMIAGIGFTMSLFIGSLAFGSGEMMEYTRLGVILGSLASAVGGIILLALAMPEKDTA